MESNIIRQWKKPPKYLSIETDQVHVWRIRWDVQESDAIRLVDLLSKSEYSQAGKFYFEADRIRYIVIRAALRMILGDYIGLAPDAMEIAYSQYGKPYLSSPNIEKDINFNVSHAGSLGLIAFTVGRRIGVDLELVREENSIESISRRFFNPEETRQILQLPASLQPEAFFTCWTRKEAFVKARGEGLSIPLNQFEVSCYPNSYPKLMNLENIPGESGHWSMFHLEPGFDFVGALVVEGEDLDVMGWDCLITHNCLE